MSSSFCTCSSEKGFCRWGSEVLSNSRNRLCDVLNLKDIKKWHRKPGQDPKISSTWWQTATLSQFANARPAHLWENMTSGHTGPGSRFPCRIQTAKLLCSSGRFIQQLRPLKERVRWKRSTYRFIGGNRYYRAEGVDLQKVVAGQCFS